MTINTLEKLIHKKIPLTKAMGLRVKKSSSQQVRFLLPKKPNLNHVGTVFGGTIGAAQAVACWGWLLNFFESEKLHGDSLHVVLRSSQSSYLAPVKNDLVVECVGPDKKAQRKFLKDLKMQGRARIVIGCAARSIELKSDQSCVQFEGVYVVSLK